MRITGALPPMSPASTGVAAVAATNAPRAKSATQQTRPAQTADASGPSRANSSPAPSVDALLALGGVEDDRERRRRMANGLFSGLELLDELHRELTLGRLSVKRLDELSVWLQETETPSNPKLAELVSEIALRVAVELAKLGR